MVDFAVKLTPLLCQACGKEINRLVVHHWYELPNLEIHTREICASCNSILKSHRFYPRSFYREHKNSLHHILPAWEKQLETIKLFRFQPPKSDRRDTAILPVRVKKSLLLELNQAVKASRQPSRNAWMIWLIKEGLRSHKSKGELTDDND